MTGDCHVRFCESAWVRFPCATRLLTLPRDGESPYFSWDHCLSVQPLFIRRAENLLYFR
jgi:hypothetical protein